MKYLFTGRMDDRFPKKKIRKDILNAFCILSGICILSVSTILRANFYYKDDIGRFLKGYRGWEASSRYLSNMFATILSASVKARDISPASQMLSALIMAVSCLVLAEAFRKDESISIHEVIASMPLALCPYFLECYDFKFDSPFMAASVLFGVYPILTAGKRYRIYIPTVFLGTLGVCMTYQASTGIFPIVVLFMAYQKWSSGRENFKSISVFVGISAFCYLAALLFYKLCLIRKVPGYVNEGALPPLSQLFPVMWKNISRYYTHVYLDYSITRFWIMVLLLLFAIFAMTAGSKRNKVVSCLFSLMVMLLSGILIHGIYTVIPEIYHAPRYVCSFGILPAMAALQAVQGRQRIFIIPRILSTALSWLFLIYCIMYGNALAEQGRYQEYQLRTLAAEMNHLEVPAQGKKVKYRISGYIGSAPAVKNMYAKSSLLSRLMPSVSGGYMWTGTKLYHYYGLKKIESRKNEPMWEYDLPLLVDTGNYSIYGNDEYVWIKWLN